MIVFGDGDIIKNHVSSSGNAFPLDVINLTNPNLIAASN